MYSQDTWYDFYNSEYHLYFSRGSNVFQSGIKDVNYALKYIAKTDVINDDLKWMDQVK